MILEVEGLEAGYGPATVLHGLDLTVSEGEGVVVLGPNGHGKSTLLRSISGILTPTAGTLRFTGQEITAWRADEIATAGLVHIPQGDALFGEMTVHDNLLMGSFVKAAWEQRHARIERVYELLPQLKSRYNLLASNLSGGERRMLAIGRGLMADAKLLMIDEPSLGLAPLLIEQVYEQIQAIKESGLAILLADENADHISGLADRVFLLESGLFVREGPAEALLADEALLAAYLG
jgi:branched-chain amino acid transport system ATP-binding protein